MSKRHQSSRRRSYGRRQHEVREREHRGARVRPYDTSPGAPEAIALARGPLGSLDSRTPRLRAAAGA